jgi:hypothetical protein
MRLCGSRQIPLVAHANAGLCAVVAGAVFFVSLAAAKAEDCRPIIVKEGYLSQAQFECDFEDLSEALVEASRKCGDSIGKDAVGEALKEGEHRDFRGAERGSEDGRLRGLVRRHRQALSGRHN